MVGVGVIEFLILLAILLTIVAGMFVIGVVAMTRAGSGARGGKLREQEAHLLQEIHRGLRQMDARVEALETILLSEESKATKGTMA